MLSVSFLKIVWLKKLDVVCQIIGFIAMICCIYNNFLDLGPFHLYLMAVLQLISCACWGIMLMNKPKMRSRATLQRSFIVTTLLLVLALVCAAEVFFCVSLYIMIWLGPVFGISYFVTTIKEISFYRALVHRDAI